MKVKDNVESKRNIEAKSLQLNFASQMLENEFPDIKDLASRLHFSPIDGRIWLDDSRMILLHNEAFGALRQELIESLGVESARGLLTRMGYLAGFKDADLARKIRPNETQMNMFMVGPQLHGLEGIVFVEPVRMEMDSETGHFYCECLWKDSSEDESHIAIYGLGTEPTCWMQIGYASGYCSAFMGKRILFRETECASMGAAHCRVVGKPVENWENAEQDLKYLQAQPLKPANTSKIIVKTLLTTTLSNDITTSQLNSQSLVIGASAGYFGVIHRINRVASTRATVLLLGESGVGKSMFASEVHRKSGRADQPFIELNCAAIPEVNQ